MGRDDLAPNPPPTKVLSVEETQLTPEEVAELGKEKVETEEVPVIEPKTIKPETEEVLPEPGEGIGEEEEITHDPLLDTKRRLTTVEQENAKLKKMFTAAIASKQLDEIPTAQQIFNLPLRPTIPKPEVDEEAMAYTQKVIAIQEQQQTYDAIVSDYESFVAEHPDFLELMPIMQKVSRRFPELMVGRRAMHKAYELAILFEEAQARQDARKDELAGASAMGAKIEREKIKAGSAFVKPGAKVASKPSMPNFANMEMWEIEKWLKDNHEKAKSLGLIKEE